MAYISIHPDTLQYTLVHRNTSPRKAVYEGVAWCILEFQDEGVSWCILGFRITLNPKIHRDTPSYISIHPQLTSIRKVTSQYTRIHRNTLPRTHRYMRVRHPYTPWYTTVAYISIHHGTIPVHIPIHCNTYSYIAVHHSKHDTLNSYSWYTLVSNIAYISIHLLRCPYTLRYTTIRTKYIAQHRILTSWYTLVTLIYIGTLHNVRNGVRRLYTCDQKCSVLGGFILTLNTSLQHVFTLACVFGTSHYIALTCVYTEMYTLVHTVYIVLHLFTPGAFGRGQSAWRCWTPARTLLSAPPPSACHTPPAPCSNSPRPHRMRWTWADRDSWFPIPTPPPWTRPCD